MDREVLQVRDQLLAFVVRSFNVASADVDVTSSLIDQGVIDSFGLIEMTAFIEKELGVTVREQDMTREAFGSLDKMAIFVVSHRGQR